MTTISVTAELREWRFWEKHGIFTGHIYSDKKGRWSDGTLMRTSKVTSIYHYELMDIVVTLNSTYLLYHDQEWKNVVRNQIPGEGATIRL